MQRQAEGFIIENYGRKSTFSSFLPGISGIHGIPVWCYYVNRGQCVASFGVEDKDHAIMEFSPAHQAYQMAKRTGFRTFIKRDGMYFEPFKEEEIPHSMKIEMNGLEITETNAVHGIQTTVNYFTLPGENVGALVRKTAVKNIGRQDAQVEVLDGMPALVPYGINMDNLKNMVQTAKAWMQVENGIDEDPNMKVPYFRVRASLEDSTAVQEVVGGNFSFACLEDGTKLSPIVDPDIIFSYDTSLEKAVGFISINIEELNEAEQVMQNQFPCSFYGTDARLQPQEELVLYQVIGQVSEKGILREFVRARKNKDYFDAKKKEADRLTGDLCSVIHTQTASEEFDAYCKQTYLDNVLRGGYPILLGKDKVFYVYSRKHGDLERDYNYFRMLPEFYSQGNGNFRDVNQNRRCDVAFTPYVGDLNIKNFYNLIQLDGYNPLGVEKVSYTLTEKDAEEVVYNITCNNIACNKEAAVRFFVNPFTPGAFFKELHSWGITREESFSLFEEVMEKAQNRINGDFIEGYWTDHWTYNLDLIEEYLRIYPEKEAALFTEEAYTYYVSQVNINKRQKRYEKTENGIRQYHPLDEKNKKISDERILKSDYGKGGIIFTNLFEKLILLCAVKFAALDAYGMGIEMEGGKPGWYDALNGLAGLLGSSMCETYELGRNLEFTMSKLKKYRKDLSVLTDIAWLVESLAQIAGEEMPAIESQVELITFWNKINDVKESYREKTFHGVSGARKALTADFLISALETWLHVVRIGIKKACGISGDICPTYFAYDVTEYEETGDGIRPLHFKVRKIPYFLEGPVRYLKLNHSMEHRKELYQKVKNSGLYDSKLSMYKVNTSLAEASYEIGRAKVFTPGWLENESIWLHMEYKYLLELLKSSMYEEFEEDFRKALIPFMDPEVYGRSILENSSFIASSDNPNPKYRGKGFVARLSGSTVEFIHMWQIMMFGNTPFTVENGELAWKPRPLFPEYLVCRKASSGDETGGRVIATLLGTIEVTYRLDEQKSYIPGEYQVKEIKLSYQGGETERIIGDSVAGQFALDIREGKVNKITVEII